MPTSATAHRNNPDFANMGWGMLEIDIKPYLTEKVNVTLPRFVIQQIGRYVRDHNVKSRSSFLQMRLWKSLGGRKAKPRPISGGLRQNA